MSCLQTQEVRCGASVTDRHNTAQHHGMILFIYDHQQACRGLPQYPNRRRIIRIHKYRCRDTFA